MTDEPPRDNHRRQMIILLLLTLLWLPAEGAITFADFSDEENAPYYTLHTTARPAQAGGWLFSPSAPMAGCAFFAIRLILMNDQPDAKSMLLPKRSYAASLILRC